jgi:hypothetical protein
VVPDIGERPIIHRHPFLAVLVDTIHQVVSVAHQVDHLEEDLHHLHLQAELVSFLAAEIFRLQEAANHLIQIQILDLEAVAAVEKGI